MKLIMFSVVAVAMLAGVVASFTPASGHADEQASPIYGVTVPPGYRDWQLIAVKQLHFEGMGEQLRAGDPITVDALYTRWANFIKPNDILVAETGTSSMGLAFALLPKGAQFYNQTLWGAIGWATPAAFGAAVAAPDRRVVLITGEGSHQLTAQEISQLGRRGLKPVVFVLNNNGYLIERLLCRNPDIAYNDLAQWHYTDSLQRNRLFIGGCGLWQCVVHILCDVPHRL